MARREQLLLRLLLVLLTIVMAWGVDELGPPISPEEFAKAKGEPTLRAPPPEKENAIENSGKFQGDILITREERSNMMNDRSDMKFDLWENGIIPYTITSEFDDKQRLVIADAMAEYADKTCIKFVGRTTEDDYIHIQDNSGCSSWLGRIGGKQLLNLNKTGCIYFGIVIHEFMHASGFGHEQSRNDRDDYVIIHYENIKPGEEDNFELLSIKKTTDLKLPYDYGSVMHYSATTFSKNGDPTITPKKKGQAIGQRDGFSKLDVRGLNLVYECKDTCKDQHKKCAAWKKKGYCNKKKQKKLMKKCPKACKKC